VPADVEEERIEALHAALDRYPFSAKPDRPLTVPELMAVIRDHYEGTEFDLTTKPAFKSGQGRSPLACPWAPPELLACWA
jgi:dipeptidase